MIFNKKKQKELNEMKNDIISLKNDIEAAKNYQEDDQKKIIKLSTQFSSVLSGLEELTIAMNELKEKTDKIDEVLEDYENFSIEKALAKKSDEPWAGLSISEIDKETGRVGLKVDWNDRFQEHLKRSGIPGNTDDERMSIWLTSLIKEWGDEIDEETAKKYRDDL